MSTNKPGDAVAFSYLVKVGHVSATLCGFAFPLMSVNGAPWPMSGTSKASTV